MENKQTSVAWLEDQIFASTKFIDIDLFQVIEQAKAMHKEETCQFVSDYLDDGQDLTAEEYYEQTFKPEKL
jgi:hypothetical protein